MRTKKAAAKEVPFPGRVQLNRNGMISKTKSTLRKNVYISPVGMGQPHEASPISAGTAKNGETSSAQLPARIQAASSCLEDVGQQQQADAKRNAYKTENCEFEILKNLQLIPVAHSTTYRSPKSCVSMVEQPVESQENVQPTLISTSSSPKSCGMVADQPMEHSSKVLECDLKPYISAQAQENLLPTSSRLPFNPQPCGSMQEYRLESSFVKEGYKLYRFMTCEWFYSHIDLPLFGAGSNESREFGALVRKHFPSLESQRTPLNRAQWNHIRKGLRKVTPVRRLSEAFLYRERVRLERRREKLRFLMENPLIEYTDDDLPRKIPKPIAIGALVRATIFRPRYGSYRGVVVGVETRDIPMYRVRFTEDGLNDEQEVPDYRVALEELSNSSSGTVSVPTKFLQQISQLEQALQEKQRVLHELDNVQLNITSRHQLGQSNAPEQERKKCEQLLRKLVCQNRTIIQQTKLMLGEYERFMGEPLSMADDLSAGPIIEREVVELADQLLAAYLQAGWPDDNDARINHPAEQLWDAAMQRFAERPDLREQFQRYLESSMGHVLDFLEKVSF
uniref:DIRP domain-containing protein n=1 Tax=Anopheles farauti TaxID=69004 RepID=A0A182Q0U7_9DIPT